MQPHFTKETWKVLTDAQSTKAEAGTIRAALSSAPPSVQVRVLGALSRSLMCCRPENLLTLCVCCAYCMLVLSDPFHCLPWHLFILHARGPSHL
jgi:hypothetical protein